MKKLTKKDLIYIWLITLIFLGLIYLLTKTTYLYGSVLDWYAQHISIPEYFRTLFYDTHDLLPDFAFNIGNGQNIYNFSYYGLLSPIILISYLFPHVSMTTYLISATIITVVLSTILLYIFLKNKNFSSETCLLSCIIFILSSPISLHSHRHIMFIIYMPFLILGLFGVDKIINHRKSWLLILSTFLMIMTNYYFSVGGIVCLLLYALYRYLNTTTQVNLKSMFKTFWPILYSILIAILCSAVIIVPTLATLLNNRASSNITINLKDLLIPKLNLNILLFDSYGLGLNILIVPALLNLLTKDKNHKIFGTILILFVIFNLFNYLLNGTMYIDAKSLIPLLPLYILTIAELIDDIFNKKIKYLPLTCLLIIISLLALITKDSLNKYFPALLITIIFYALYHKFNKKILFVLPLILLTCTSSYLINKGDNLELKYTTRNNEKVIKNLVNGITAQDQESLYRTAINYNRTEYPNKIFNNINYYNSNIYSSISNQTYNKFYYDLAMNNIPSRNRALTVTSPNIMYLLFSNNKYYISNDSGLFGYDLQTTNEGINVYKTANALPIAYASSNIMSYEDFNNLNDIVKQEALLNVIVANTKTNSQYKSHIKQMNLDLDKLFTNENMTKKQDGSYNINVKDSLKLTYSLPTEYQNKILFIRFKMKRVDSHQDLAITINSVKNKLTNSKWKYYNDNTIFDYVLAFNDQDKLTISFSEGEFNIGDFETYYLDYNYLTNLNDNISPFIIDLAKTKGDFIEGDIQVKDDGYFIATIPYDKGFNIKVDDNQVDYEKVDDAFIGMPIAKGSHHLKIEYKSPGKTLAIYLSLFGLLLFIISIFFEHKKFNKE